jgi:hypothetical protein
VQWLPVLQPNDIGFLAIDYLEAEKVCRSCKKIPEEKRLAFYLPEKQMPYIVWCTTVHFLVVGRKG